MTGVHNFYGINVKPVTPSSLSPCPPPRTREQGSVKPVTPSSLSPCPPPRTREQGSVKPVTPSSLSPCPPPRTREQGSVKPVTPSSLSPCPPPRTREQGSAGRSSIGGFSAWDHVHVKLNGTVMIRRRRITPQTDYPSVSNAKTANV